MRDNIRKYLDKWDNSLQINDLGDETSNLSIAIITQILFGADFTEDFLARYQSHPYAVFKTFSSRLAKTKLSWSMFFPDTYRILPIPDNYNLNQEINQLREAARIAIINRKERKTRKYNYLSDDMDFLDTILQHVEMGTYRKNPKDTSYLEADRAMDEDELVDQVMAFIYGGFAPCGRFLQYSLYCLFKYPEQIQLLKNEIDEVFSANDSFRDLDFTHKLTQLKYMNSFQKEVLRMYPPNSDTDIKISQEDHQITDGQRKYFIPKGTRVKLGAYGTQMNPK